MTDAELTLLSLLTQQPRYGHELQQMIDARGLREWMTIGFSSIYYLLNRLEKQQFVTSESDGRGTAHKRYQLTDAGRGVLQTAIADLLREPRSLGSGFELGLANLDALKPAQVYRVLTDHQHDLQRRHDLVAQAWEEHQADHDLDDYLNIQALYTHSLALMTAELDWLAQFLAAWQERYPDSADEQVIEAASPNSAATWLSSRATPDPLKMIQRLKPIYPERSDEDPSGGDSA